MQEPLKLGVAGLGTVGSGLLRLIEPPYRSPRADLSLLYLGERLAEPAMAWMRDQMHEIAADI